MASHSAPSLPPPPSSLVPTLTPASLSSLAIYNPSLGPTDETVADQVVFYTSRVGSAEDDEDAKLRHIGLAQGVVGFARDFSNSDDGSTWVDTQKARIVVVETEEKGWWIVAKIELTYLHNPTTQPAKSEWSSREVSPPQLISAQLRRAYLQYRFRYGSFEEGLKKLGRPAFCKKLNKYWNRWAWNKWEVMLFRNPALDFLGDHTVKMAGARRGGEIEEQEKRFLEGWIKKEKARGVLDVVVSRFGRPEPIKSREREAGHERTGSQDYSGYWFWGKAGKESKSLEENNQDDIQRVVGPDDGCVFRGIGELSTESVIDMTNYLAELYETTEGSSTLARSSSHRRQPRRKRRGHHGSKSLQLASEIKGSREAASSAEPSPRNSSFSPHPRGANGEESKAAASPSQPEIPSTSHIASSATPADPPIEGSPPLGPMVDLDPQPQEDAPVLEAPTPTSSDTPLETNPANPYTFHSSKVMNLLTFGWTGSRTHSPAPSACSAQAIEPTSSAPTPPRKPPSTPGRFIIGFQGDLDIEDLDDDYELSDGRITSRTVWITPSSSRDARKEYRIVVYAHPPLYFSFLLEPTSRHLTSSSFYREIHHQLSPLVHRILKPPTLSNELMLEGCYAFLYTPSSSSLYCTLPAIPDPGTPVATEAWTRVDALHVNTIVLGMLADTDSHARRTGGEKSIRSSRGWWVHWVQTDEGEGVLVRKPGKKPQGKNSGAEKGKKSRGDDEDGKKEKEVGVGEGFDKNVRSVLERLLKGE